MAFISSCFSLFLLLFLLAKAQAHKDIKTFNVFIYGAVGDGRADDTQAFMRAWKEACEWKGKARVLVPHGLYILNEATFEGPCNTSVISFLIKGTLSPSPQLPIFTQQSWITFKGINNLVLSGGSTGLFYGRGEVYWPVILSNCRNNSGCPLNPSISFNFVNNSRIHHLRSVNTKNTHFSIYGSYNLNIHNIRITAPNQSPNTDGIKIAKSQGIKISNSVIGTGDDCISILYGSRHVRIHNVACGPGHGISIGSLGKYKNEDDVYGIEVKNCSFTGTTNGLRIKTWGTRKASKVSNLTFEGISMDGVCNPIYIDQKYCPYPPCKQHPSHVQIKDTKYKNIWGTSRSKVGVNLQCSKSMPCENFELSNINLVNVNPKEILTSFCVNIHGVSYGIQKPPSCV